jgi:hypothetical protein
MLNTLLTAIVLFAGIATLVSFPVLMLLDCRAEDRYQAKRLADLREWNARKARR